MKNLHVSEDMVPFGIFKTHASKVMRRLREGKRPVVITQHGTPAGVLVCPQDFDRWRDRDRFVEAVEEGLSNIKEGRVVDDGTLFRELKAEFGPSRKK